MNMEPDGRALPKQAKVAIRAGVALAVFLALGLAVSWLDEGQRYLWVKAIHVIAVISWMAGLLYMPRLFVYHTEAEIGSIQSETFKVMEQRLYRIIMTPAMLVAWALGLYMAWSAFGFHGGWLHAKLASVLALSAVHDFYGRSIRSFAADQRRHDGRFWRLMNEVPTVLMIVIVILVIVKPF